MTKAYHTHEIRDAIVAAEYDSTKEERILEELRSLGVKEITHVEELTVRLAISVYQRIFYDEFLKTLEGKR